MTRAPSLIIRSTHSFSASRIVIGVVVGTVIVVVAMTGGILYLFSRKERVKRKLALQQAEPYHAVQVPPAYKMDVMDVLEAPRTAQPRPLSTFAPDYGRQHQYRPHYQYQQQQQQQARYSYELPPPYQTVPTYDPSRYQPVRPTSTASADPHSYARPNVRGESSRLSAVHYHDARLSMVRSSLVADPSPPPTMSGQIIGPSHNRRQSALPYPAGAAVAAQGAPSQLEGRERSISEPMPPATGRGARGPRRPKPVLSKLITNFR